MESSSCDDPPRRFLLVPDRANLGIPHLAGSTLGLDFSHLYKQTTGYRWSQWSNIGLRYFCQPHQWRGVLPVPLKPLWPLSYKSDKYSWVSSALTLLWKSRGGDRGDRWSSACLVNMRTWVGYRVHYLPSVRKALSSIPETHMCYMHTHTQFTYTVSWRTVLVHLIASSVNLFF